MPQPSSTLCKLERGAFRVTAEPICHQGVNSFDVTVTDLDVWVTHNFPASTFNYKRILSVQDLGWAFYSIMVQAHQGRFPNDMIHIGDDWQIKKRLYAEYRRLRSHILAMDIPGEDLPDIMKELRAKYDLTKYEFNRGRGETDPIPSDLNDSIKYAIGVDVGFPGSDHSVMARVEKGGLDFFYIDAPSQRDRKRLELEMYYDDIAWCLGLSSNRRTTYIVPDVKRLDYMIARGCKPSRLIIGSELRNDSEIFTVHMDEAKEISAEDAKRITKRFMEVTDNG